MSVLSKLYSRIFWKNYPSTDSPLDEVDLNRMDAAIDGIDDRLIQVDTVKFDKTSASGLLAEVALNSETGDLTLTYYSGSKKVIHTNLAKIAINISYDAVNERLVMHMPDGTDAYVDMSALITQFEFLDSDTIAFEVTADGKVKAGIRTGSVTEDMLRPNFLADVKIQAAKAEKSATQAAAYETGAAYDAKLAQSYSIGGSGIREGEDSDNARYYREQAQAASDSASGSASTASAAAQTATSKAEAAGTSAASAESSAGNAAASAQTATAQAESAGQSASTATSAAATVASKAEAAGTSATQAAGSANLARSYAVGSAGAVREGDATDNAKYYKEQAERIAEGLKGSLLPMGTITFAELPDTSNAGYMFNVSDEFTTTARFKEGAGHVVPAGTNVYYTADGYWDCMAGSPVTGVKGSAENSYRRGNVNITSADIGLGLVPNVATDDQTPKFSRAASRANLVSGERLSVLFGKIMRFFEDLKEVAFSGDYNDLSNRPSIPAAVAVKGSAESAYRTGNVNLSPENLGITVVNNTADSQKSVLYAASAGSAATAASATAAGKADCDGNGKNIAGTYLPISRHGALYTVPMTVWSVVTEGGVEFVTYITGCCIFLSDTKCDLHLDILLRDNFNNTSVGSHTHMVNLDAIKSALSMQSLTFDVLQTKAEVLIDSDAFGSYTLEDVVKAGNSYNGDFSGYRFTQDGRISRLYYDATGGIVWGNMYVNTGTVLMAQGNVWRVDIYGAVYS